jgi:hypothetical protein
MANMQAEIDALEKQLSVCYVAVDRAATSSGLD